MPARPTKASAMLPAVRPGRLRLGLDVTTLAAEPRCVVAAIFCRRGGDQVDVLGEDGAAGYPPSVQAVGPALGDADRQVDRPTEQQTRCESGPSLIVYQLACKPRSCITF